MGAKTLNLGIATLAIVLFVPVVASIGFVSDDDEPTMPWDRIQCSDAPEEVKDLFHVFPEPSDPTLLVAVHTVCYKADLGDDHRGTACASHGFNQLNYKWNAAYSGKVDAARSGLAGADALNAFDASGNSWDVETATDIYANSIQGGNGRNAGRLDDVNQIGWKRLAAGTIAQTTTWYRVADDVAVESDGAYNTRFTWGVDGAANKMDAQNIMTHEIGHTFGLGHPANNAANECLTMYAFGAEGETAKRTLGDGDILGIEAIYGA